jgi:Zn-dependent protease
MDFDLSPDRLRMIAVGMITLILSIAVHEFGHAIVADKLGDPTPRTQGRVTLNPLAHIDPLGTILFPLIGFFSGVGFGWGRPVQVTLHLMTRRIGMRTANMIVAAAGPTMNLLFGVFISLIVMVLVRLNVSMNPELLGSLAQAVLLNFLLMFFNLIPSAPLDGGAVVGGLLPEHLARPYLAFTQRYGIFILLAFIIPRSPLQKLYLWPAAHLYQFWMGLLLGQG